MIKQKYRPKLFALEDRIMYDAAVGATVDAVGKNASKAVVKPTPEPPSPVRPAEPTPITPTTPTDPATVTPTEPMPEKGNNSNNDANSNKGTPDNKDDNTGNNENKDNTITDSTTSSNTDNNNNEVDPIPEPPAVEPPGNNGNNNNSTTPTDSAAGAGKSDEEKNDKNVSGSLGNQGNNETKEDIKGNAGGDGNNNGNPDPKPEDPPKDDHNDEEDHDEDNGDNDEPPPPPPPPPPPENLAPDAVDDSVSTDYDTPIAIDVVYNDTDPELDPVTIDSFTQPNYGTVALVDGKMVYTPPAGFSGTATFTYTIIDDHGNKDTATVTVLVGDKPNDPPKANDDDYTTDYDKPVTLDLLSNDNDPNGDPIVIVGMTDPQNGSLSLVNGALVFTPAPGFSGTTTFNYTIRDSRGLESTATVTITVGQAPPPPPPPEPPPPPPPPPPPEPPPEPPPPPPPEPPPPPPPPEPPVVPPTPPVVPPTPPVVPPIVVPPPMAVPPAPPGPGTTVGPVGFTPVMAPSISFPDNFQPLFNTLNSLVITMPASFTTTATDNGLFVLKPPESVTVGDNRAVDYRLPPDTFASTDPSAKIDVVARQTNGAPLPEGIKFDPVTGKISGTMPPGVNVLDITIEATDSNGNKATAQFNIRAGEIKEKISLLKGKPTLSQQIAKAIQKFRLT